MSKPMAGDRSRERKRILTSRGWFTLWLEFEQWVPEPTDDPYDEFFIANVRTEDERTCGLDVWTYKHLMSAVERARSTGEYLSGRYMLAPDLFVEKADRDQMEAIIKELLEQGDLEERLDLKQLGFRVVFRMSREMSEQERNEIFRRFNDALGGKRILFDGVLDDSSWNAFVGSLAEGKVVTEDDRRTAIEWLRTAPDVVQYEVGPLTSDWGSRTDPDDRDVRAGWTDSPD